jgi:hypothetical protein
MRELAWDGYVNAKDLGGLPTALSPSGVTAFGRVARGPRRERLTALGWQQARDWGLRAIVDLRCAHEVGPREGDPQLAPASIADITVADAPTEDQSDEEFRRVCFPILDSPEYWAHNWRLQPHLVRGALEAVAAAGPGVLVHCSAGRDRTGMIAALLLGNAGVVPDAVAQDYAHSVRAIAGAAIHAPTVDRQSRWTADETDAWLADKLPIVRETAASAPQIMTDLGVHEGTRERLRGLLVA